MKDLKNTTQTLCFNLIFRRAHYKPYTVFEDKSLRINDEFSYKGGMQ